MALLMIEVLSFLLTFNGNYSPLYDLVDILEKLFRKNKDFMRSIVLIKGLVAKTILRR